MSLRSSRRSQAAAASAAGFEIPSVPISEIRTRKWTKQPKTVGHITILKWVPDQENPTEALQKGAFRKTKGRKRPVVELGRVTRSVRQHLDAPLELLNDVPITRHSAKTIMVPTAVPVPDATNPASAPVVASVAVTVTTLPATTTQMPVAPVPPLQDMGMLSSEDQLLEMAGESLFSDTVASDEQLERALDDLPFLDTDNLAMDPALALGMPERSAPPAAAVPAPQQGKAMPEIQVKEDAASSSSASSGEDEDEDDGDASASPMPSPSPTTSPMMSRSPSP